MNIPSSLLPLTFSLILATTSLAAPEVPHFSSLPETAPPKHQIFQVGDILAQRIPDTNTLVWMGAADAVEPQAEAWKPIVELANPVECVQTKEALVLQHLGKPILRYNITVQKGPEGTDPVYQRSGYIHPVYNPAGQEITGDFAPDHAHQHGLFFAWTNTTFEGRDIDFWNQRKQQGNISHSKVLSSASGPVFGQFQVEILHEDTTEPASPKPVLREVWTVRAYATQGDHFLYDIISEQRCSSDSPLTVNEYHYGAMAIRGNADWVDEDRVGPLIKEWTKASKKNPDLPPPLIEDLPRDYLTNEGKTWHDGNHSRPKWVDMYGDIDGEPSGVAVLAHPSNFRFPQPVRLHPSKPYFCFAPQVLGEFQIEPGEVYTSQYRYFIHPGEPDAEAIEAQWQAYAK